MSDRRHLFRASSSRQAPTIQRVHSSNPVSYGTAVGLALLYSSGFFSSCVHRENSYFIASIWNGVIFPTLIAVVTIASLARLVGAFLEKYKRRSFVPEAARLALTLLVFLGIRGLAAAGGYNLESVLGLMVNHDPSLTILWAYKLAFLLVLISVIYAAIRMLAWPGGVRRLVRFSTALGFSLFALTVFNLLQLAPYDEGKAPPQASTDRKGAASVAFQAEKSKAPRRVVWVIFDELDYKLVFDDSVRQSSQGLENFQHLAENGVSARQALTPSNATITSIPSLLMGTQTAGAKFLGPANYRMLTSTGKPLQPA